MVRVGLIAEDQSDRAVLEAVIRKALPMSEVAFEHVRARGDGEIIARWEKLVGLLAPVDCVVLCIDADGRSLGADPLSSFRTRVKRAGLLPVIPVQKIEGWLLADDGAVRKVTGHRAFRAIANTETNSDPKKVLKRTVRSGRRRPEFNERRDNPKLANEMDLTLARGRNRSLDGFCRDIGAACSETRV